MEQQKQQSRFKIDQDKFWDLIIALRFYLIIIFLMLPVILLSINLKYIQPVSLIIFGFSILLIVKLVLFEPRKQSIIIQKISLAVLITCASFIFLNFILGFIFQIIQMNLIGIIIPLFICIGSVLFFLLTVPKKRFKRLNSRLILWKLKWASRGKHTRVKRNVIAFGSINWLLFSTLLILVPYPVYIQLPPDSIEGQRIGIWAGSGSFNESHPDYLPNNTLEMLSDSNSYIVTTVKINSLGSELANWFNRCKEFDIEIHLSLSATAVGIYSFVNVWTIENLMNDIETIIEWLNTSNFLGNPVTTAVYDMEGLVKLSFFEFLVNTEAKSKLSEYYRITQLFLDFNQRIRDEYNLEVQICGDLAQGFDLKDGDDDIISLYGLLSDGEASRSYMIYRKDTFNLNHVLDSCRLLNEGDTIILNSWKIEGCKCWEDLNCVIEEARLVFSIPGKKFNLEIWRLDNFLDSYGLDGLHEFIEALTSNPSDWPIIYVWYHFFNSAYSDLIFLMNSYLDLYSPLLKFIFHAY